MPKNVQTSTALFSHISKVILKILQARLHQYVDQELPDVQAGFSKGRGTRDQIANIHWVIEQENSRKTSTSVSLTWLKPLTVWITTNWKILKEMGIPDHLTCLLRSLYAGQEARVRTRCGTTDWFHFGKGVHQGFVLSPCLFNFYEECCSVTQSCPTLCYPMNCSTPGLPALHHLLKFAQVQVH